jgi:hypothetical protein
VEEESATNGDLLLKINYNPTCPGLGKGKLVDRRKLEKLVADQFLQRTEDIAPQIEALRISGAILESASVFRTLPGRRS